MVHEWQLVKSSDNEFYSECQRMTTGGTKNDNEWLRAVQRVTTSGTTSENKWQRVRTSDKETTSDKKRMKTNESK